MDLSGMMEMAKQLQGRLAGAQEQAAKLRASGEAGGGLVRAVVNGVHDLVELWIDPKAVVASEVELLTDLVRAAVNQANARMAETLRGQVEQMARDLSGQLPGFGPSGVSK